MIQFRDKEIENERLVLDSKTELYYLGHNLTLRNCTLVIKVPERALVIAKTRLIDCTIEVKQELKNFRWDHVHLKGCRFTGRLTGCEFGYREEEWEEAGIEACDFSEARLDLCQFSACDVSTLRFPSWPCFTILDPLSRLEELARVPWPGQVGSLVELLADGPEETAAVTILATTYGKHWGASEAQIKAVLERLDGVVY